MMRRLLDGGKRKLLRKKSEICRIFDDIIIGYLSIKDERKCQS